MRIGQNPAKAVESVHQPARVTVAVITYIPFLSGYYREALEVLKVCLESIHANTDLPYELMVFDNASCTEVVDYLLFLKKTGRIDYLLLSAANLGKVGAWNAIFGAAPGEFIAYSDFDVYYHPGWLSRHLEVFEAFPEAGTVSGLPRRGRRDFYTNTLSIADTLPGVRLEEGKFIPDEWIIEHARSLGKLDTIESDLQLNDYRLTRGDVSAYATATHFQFMVRTDVVRRILPLPYDRPMGPVVAEFDRAMNQGNLIRLSVTERVVQHLGNTLSPIIKIATTPSRERYKSRIFKKFLLWKPVRWMLMRLYDRIFHWYYN
jgi:glycosyltransferase involved in cell wall biosynthesis